MVTFFQIRKGYKQKQKVGYSFSDAFLKILWASNFLCPEGCYAMGKAFYDIISIYLFIETYVLACQFNEGLQYKL